MAAPCPPACACGCTDPRGSVVHPVCVAIDAGDVDRALALGMMELTPCPSCRSDCVAMLVRVQSERQQALAARDRYRQREARLQRLQTEREQRRSVAATSARVITNAPSRPADSAGVPAATPAGIPALPPAAAAALARAREKAAARMQANSAPKRNAEQ